MRNKSYWQPSFWIGRPAHILVHYSNVKQELKKLRAILFKDSMPLLKIVKFIIHTFITMDEAKKILVLDDAPDNAEVLEMLFEDLGYVSKSITTHENLLDILHAFKPDLIIMDVYLRTVSGKSICLELKSSPDFSHIPIILMSANNKAHDMEANDCNADGFIEKPFDIYELNEMVEKTILPNTFG